MLLAHSNKRIHKQSMSLPSSAPITVVGSLNLDLIASVMRLPAPGETVAALGITRRFGGKGANQALAASRHGGSVSFIGCLGDDPDGRDYRNHLRREGINCSAVGSIRNQPTGSAFITVDAAGENQIVVIPGANGQLSGPTVKMQRSRIAVSKALLVQLEVPLETVVDAITIANQTGVPVVLNPSPANADFPWGKVSIQHLIVNEAEARALFDLNPAHMAKEATAWRKKLSAKKVQTLVVTRGGDPTLILSQDTCEAVPTIKVKPIDTVGAGDAFAGAYTCQIAEGASLINAVVWANAAGALATQKVGAQEGIPLRGEVQSVLQKQGHEV